MFWKGDVLHMDGETMHMDVIARVARDQLQHAIKVIEEKLLFGKKLSEICPDFDMESISDNLGATGLGYGFLNDPANPFQGMHQKLSERIMSDAVVSAMFGSVKDSAIQLDENQVSTWLDTCSEVTMALFIANHTSQGMPSRSTEAGELTFVNGRYRRRNLVVVAGEPCVLGGYNKTTHTTGRDKDIARGIWKVLGEVLIKFLAVVRPVQVMLVDRVVAPSKLKAIKENLKQLVWTDHKGVWNHDKMSPALQRAFLKYTGLKMNIRNYRHVSATVMRRYVESGMIKSREMKDYLLNLCMLEQFGHGEEVHYGTYGMEGGGSALKGTSESKLKFQMEVSDDLA
jgi:hypothetical protein